MYPQTRFLVHWHQLDFYVNVWGTLSNANIHTVKKIRVKIYSMIYPLFVGLITV